MSRCLNQPMLERFATADGPPAEAAAMEGHILACRRCARRLAALPDGADLVERIRDLEKSRRAIAPALSKLSETTQRLTTTLFGVS